MQQFQFEKVESCSNDLGEQTSRFRLQGLAQGQGLTIGNTLRRVLLTELEGTAITAVQIKGINNEFAPNPGVREDGLEILLNLNVNIYSNFLELEFPKNSKNLEINFVENKDNFSDEEWRSLYKLSENTFVEETDSLKKGAAGAGLTDND